MFPPSQSLLFLPFPVIFFRAFFSNCVQGKSVRCTSDSSPHIRMKKKGFPFQTTINPRRENGVSASATVIFTTRKGGEKRHCTPPRFPHSTPRKLSIVFSFRGGGGGVNYGVMLRSPTNADFIHMFRVYICPATLLHMCFEVINQGSLLLFSHPLKSHRKRNVISLSSY